ncbi:MAG: GtrA family protein [Parcubacteria group bacterium]|nr:GtrA family protein [Parcubacteria group bacterium]MCR4343003.1 GtrA family protein [Patescibacteria group bacterium]
MFTRRDFTLTIIAGILTGILSLPILKNLRIDFRYIRTFFIVGVPLSFIIGVYISSFFARRFVWIYQFSKYASVGFLNTMIDFGVLNLLSLMTGIYSGGYIIVLNSVAAIFSTTNGYFWNKYWTFGSEEKAHMREFIYFAIAGFTGLLINTTVVYFITTFTRLPGGVDGPLLENTAKVFATIASMAWNFYAFKFLVFKK